MASLEQTIGFIQKQHKIRVQTFKKPIYER